MSALFLPSGRTRAAAATAARDPKRSLTWGKIPKIGTRIVRHGRDIVFQLAEIRVMISHSGYWGW
jgi:hypothetical protein